ncbi:MAG: Ni/Fe hydrogenase subunit alpha [Deltaproteobacteria bacterium]|nr:Ni/Fe hydrogenase subunit alpha [Deltaproteobacteria bacterium]
MSHTIQIKPITRIEGHGKVTVTLDDSGLVSDAKFHVTQFRGFEKFCEGRPFYEMPSLVERICGICPVSHSIASAKACDSILGVRVPTPAKKLRRLLNCGTFIQSHALSFFHLSAPDLALGFNADPAERNIVGLLKSYPALAMDGIQLRKIGQQIIESCAGKRIHPAWVVPGGVNNPLPEENRDFLLSLIPEGYKIIRRTLDWFKGLLDNYREEIRTFANFPTLFTGLVNSEGNLEHIEGKQRFLDSKGLLIHEDFDTDKYQEYLAEYTEHWSYLKSPYFKSLGYPDGIYRSGPAARLNVCDSCGTPQADQEWAEFKGLERGPVLSSFYNHYARLIEILFSLELMEYLLKDAEILSSHVRSIARNNEFEGVGVVEAPRGLLIHHYKVDEQGLITWANMIVATGHNNLAINRGILQVARRFIRGDKITEEAMNRIEGLIRSFDPCLSCSTHAIWSPKFRVDILSPDGTILDSMIS